jgi:signal transduction histidine kinase/ActR/RegA family two-component response regulator
VIVGFAAPAWRLVKSCGNNRRSHRWLAEGCPASKSVAGPKAASSMRNTRDGTSAVRTYYGLAVAALLLPLLVLCGDAWLAWQSVLRDARQGLDRALIASMEQAARILDTQTLAAARVNDLLGGADDAAVREHEAQWRDQIMAMIQPFPPVTAVIVSDSRGQALLAAPPYPNDPAITLADSDDFPALRNGRTQIAVSATFASRLTGQPAFSVARSRGDDAGDDPRQFQGVIVVLVASRYFEAFNRSLFNDSVDYTAGLYREDGAVLARYPSTQAMLSPAPRTNSLLMAAIAHDPAGGMLRGEAIDGTDRLVAYRRLDAYPVYASVSRSWHSIVVEWRKLIASHLTFGIPATIALFTLSMLAAGRARREGAALAALQAETQRRAQAEDALRQAQKMEAVGRLTGGIAHDFNNHLTVISSNVELLKRRLPDAAADLARLADAAMRGVRRAATLTQRLLAFSRQQALDPEPLDASQLVDGMLDLLRRTLGEGIAVETVSAGKLWLTRIDANQLESALLNLAVNARDAMPRGGVLTIETANTALDESYVAAHADLSAGEYVMIAVRDTGIGMTPDVQARAFEPFFTTKPFGQGTGLGLSMVYGFVAQSGGHVRIESEPGQGTTIRLYLPRYVQPKPPWAAAVDTIADRAPGAAETVLVVEDDETVRHAAVEALRDIGYQVLEAPDAMEAFRLISDRGGIDLLFTDVGLPGGVDGRALADAAHNISPGLRVLFTTGYTRDAAARSGMLDGDTHFLAKPFSLQQLEAKVREVLDAPAPDAAMHVRIESA